MNIRFSENNNDGTLQIAGLKSVLANNEKIGYWIIHFHESFINFSAFEKMCNKFALSDFKKVRLAYGLKEVWTSAVMNKIVQDTPSLKAQENLLKAMKSSIRILARYGKTVHEKSEGMALRLVIGKMASNQLPQNEIEKWFTQAETVHSEVEQTLEFIKKQISKSDGQKNFNKHNVNTYQRRLATDLLPKLCKKILDLDFFIEQGLGGEVKLTKAVDFVLHAACCIGYPLTDTALLKAHIRIKKTP